MDTANLGYSFGLRRNAPDRPTSGPKCANLANYDAKQAIRVQNDGSSVLERFVEATKPTIRIANMYEQWTAPPVLARGKVICGYVPALDVKCLPEMLYMTKNVAKNYKGTESFADDVMKPQNHSSLS